MNSVVGAFMVLAMALVAALAVTLADAHPPGPPQDEPHPIDERTTSNAIFEALEVVRGLDAMSGRPQPCEGLCMVEADPEYAKEYLTLRCQKAGGSYGAAKSGPLADLQKLTVAVCEQVNAAAASKRALGQDEWDNLATRADELHQTIRIAQEETNR